MTDVKKDQQPELTLSALLTQRCMNFAASDKAVEMIDQGIEKMFKDLIGESFRSYGDFGKLLSDAFKAALPTNISAVVDLPSYNTLVINSMREAWTNSGVHTDMQQRVLELTKEFTSDKAIPKFILASELWAAFVEDNKESACENQWEQPQVIISEGEYVDGYIRVGLEPNDDSGSRYSRSRTSAHECNVYLALSPQFNREGRTKEAILHDGHQVYELYSGSLDGSVLGKKVISAYSRFDKMIMALYYGGSLLAWDEAPDADEMTYPHHEY